MEADPLLTNSVNYGDHSYIVQDAVYIQNLYRSYGSLKVLEGLNMRVERGSIYGLLGPSGCGKTTLLKCILGQLTPDSGVLNVLGRPPYADGHFVPGSAVGYSPQELAILPSLTIRENMQLFARISGIPNTEVDKRIKEMIEFLDLPEETRMAGQLSGGQKRRLSLGMSLINKPELLILDEPTVGVDPVLRAKIWKHLVELAKEGTTVMITTHYIEEARQANRIGLMRHGVLLDENDPNTLMAKYNQTSLEDVFLKLCSKGTQSNHFEDIDDPEAINGAHPANSYQNGGETTDSIINNSMKSNITKNVFQEENPYDFQELKQKKSKIINNRFSLMIAIILAFAATTLKSVLRNPAGLIFALVQPSFQVILFALTIGGSPSNVNFAVVNHDIGCAALELGTFRYLECIQLFNQTIAGDEIVADLLASNVFETQQYYILEDGLDAVRRGEAYGVLYIPQNYTATVFDVIGARQCQEDGDSPYPPDEFCEDLKYQSSAKLYLDTSNQPVIGSILRELSVIIGQILGPVSPLSLNPLSIEDPIYGESNPEFLDFVGPGLLIFIVFMTSVGLTAIGFIQMKVLGVLERLFSAGMPSYAMIIGYELAEVIIIIVTVALMLAVGILGFKFPMEGSIFLAFFILLLIAFIGMSWGLFISALAETELVTFQSAIGSIIPILTFSGILWPIEAVPYWVVWFCKILPTSWAAETMRSILVRGWGIEEDIVWQSILVCLGWLVFLITISSYALSLQQRDRKFTWFKKKN